MRLAIKGAGYVGLPLALAFARFHSVICYDINSARIKKLQKGVDTNKQHLKKEILKKKNNIYIRSQFIKKNRYLYYNCSYTHK
jgi:UDP-N-acetyl-D-galactosamine dehydrogenase